MSCQDDLKPLRSLSLEDADLRPDHKSSASTLHPEFCYPGSTGDVVVSTTLFAALYEEEEFRELHTSSEDVGEGTDLLTRPTIYHVLRLFDSIRGFHQGYLDLSGRHPERYYELQSQWNRFLSNFLMLESEARTCEELHALGIPDKYFVVFSLEPWRRFQFKWRLPESTSYSQLLQCTHRVLRDLKRRPAPKFQVLRLTDLPPEVLDNIINLASITQAKMLSSTCRLLNNIGQRHIFQSWLTKLRVPPHVTPFNGEYSIRDLSLSAEYSRKDLLKNAEFLMKTPHISGRIQSLILADEWWVHRRTHSNENNPFILGMDFYKSAHQIFASVLLCASNLTTLVLRNIELGPEFARRISEMPTLHTLDLHLCRIPRMVRKRLVLESFPLSSQIANLHIYMHSSFQETHSQWYTLLLCPRIRTLSVVQFGDGTFPALDTLFWMKCQLVALERISLDNVDYRDLVELTKWFLTRGGGNGTASTTTTSNSNGSKATIPLILTHFKLHTQFGIPDSHILSLLFALRRAPLKVLVLEGLAEAEFVLFECIASQYPNLTALTLVRRQNASQRHNKLVVWPHASWEYASLLRGFQGLRHFCWNFLTEYWDATPRLLLALEEGFSSGLEKAAATTTTMPSEQTHTNCESDDLPYFLDSHWMALPFAAYCPTLQTFSLMDHSIDMVCLITRSSKTGRTILTPKYIPIHAFDSWNVQQWNTSSVHWPILLPMVGCANCQV